MVPFMITNSPGVLHEHSFNEPQKDERLSQPLTLEPPSNFENSNPAVKA